MSSRAAGIPAPDGVRLRRYLPLSLGVTLAVTLLPLVLVAQIGPARSAPAVALHVLAAVVLSMLIARVLALLWTRHEQSSDLVFGDLLLWGWVRRALAERRLDTTSERLTGSAAAKGDRAELLQRLSALLEARDAYTHGHSRRVARHAEQIARGLGLSREEVEKVRAAALVHDIGKINVPRAILTKPDRLTEAEFALVKRHAADGAVMVAELDDPQLTAIVRHHHERIDGTGYPDGLAGADIPLGARVIAVADTFDAITSTRAYRKPRTHKQALEVLQREAGTQLDPAAVAAFVSYYSARRSVGLASALAAAPQRLLSGIGGVSSGIGASVAPIAQTACGVGGAALIGACIGGSLLPSQAADGDRARAADTRQLADRDARAGGGSTEGDETDARPREGDHHPRAGIGDPRSTQSPRERFGGRRGLEVPPDGVPGDGGGAPGGGGSGGSGNGGGGSGGGGGVTVPELPPVVPELPPVVPDPPTVLEPVTDVLPSVPAPGPLPVPVPVPVPGIELP